VADIDDRGAVSLQRGHLDRAAGDPAAAELLLATYNFSGQVAVISLSIPAQAVCCRAAYAGMLRPGATR
jgi:hypothetical protein